MPVRAVEPDKGGRGIEQLRLFWTPNPAAARMRGTSCYINPVPACKALPDCAGAFPFLMISTSHGRRKQPWSSEARVAGRCRPLMSLLESPCTAPCTPSLTDLSIALSLAPGSAAPPSLMAGPGQQIALRLKNDSGGSWVPGQTPWAHASQGRGCAGVPVSPWSPGRAPAQCLRLRLQRRQPPVASRRCSRRCSSQGNLGALEDAGA